MQVSDTGGEISASVEETNRVRAALGLKPLATDQQVSKRLRQLLRLLHPDASINQPLKGTKHLARIEGAFKKLSALKMDAKL
jgi:U4/U6.U5 tri-snRNP-associated protein 1